MVSCLIGRKGTQEMPTLESLFGAWSKVLVWMQTCCRMRLSSAKGPHRRRNDGRANSPSASCFRGGEGSRKRELSAKELWAKRYHL